jgi:ribosome biogenesis GTPase
MFGIVIKSTGSWYEVQDAETGRVFRCRLRGKFKLNDKKITNPLAVGDRVTFNLEPKAETCIITEIAPRTNYIIRKSVHKTAHGHIVAANIDQAMLIASLTMPRTSLGFIDRFLVNAESFRIPSVVVFNKWDLLEDDERAYIEEAVGMYQSIGYKTLITSTVSNLNIDAFYELLKGKTTLLTGHSGVGKSTLVNTIAPDLDLRTDIISTFANKGKHTTTFAQMFELEPYTFIIDTPGIKELGMIELEAANISHYFPEMREKLNQCKYHNCIHVNEPGCVIKQAVDDGEISISRYQSYLSILFEDDNRR